MFGKKITVINILGFNIKIDASWVILATLIIWSLAAGYYPAHLKALSSAEYVLLGVVGALGLFASLIIHELSHSVVGRRMGLPIESITLFIFGGVAEMEDEPDSARTEFWMAIAGPIASAVLAVFFWGLEDWSRQWQWHPASTVTFGYLWRVNFILAAFNMLPGFPLDGGRIFRAALWAWKKDVIKATKLARRSGELISSMMMALGIISFFTGNIIGGLWWFFIALFLSAAATSSEYQLLARELFKGEPIGNYVDRQPMILTQNMSVKEAANKFLSTYHQKLLPVVDDDNLIGLVDIDSIKQIPTNKWNDILVGQMYSPFSKDHIISPYTDCLQALKRMTDLKLDTLFVVDRDFEGTVTFYELLNLLTEKINNIESKPTTPQGDQDKPDKIAS